jgi:hypothetical protein
VQSKPSPQSDEEKWLFELLLKIYTDNRYKLGYIVDPEDLKCLAERDAEGYKVFFLLEKL